MSRSGTRPVVRAVAVVLGAIALGPTMGGCAQIYWDHRDAIALNAGDAIAANEAVQVIDPWPPHSGNTNIAFNGQRMQAAAERYRANTVTQPVDPMAPQATVAASTTQTSSYGGGTSTAGTSSGATIVVGAPAATAAASQ